MDDVSSLYGLRKDFRRGAHFFRGVIRGHQNDFMTLLRFLDAVLMGSSLWLVVWLHGDTWHYHYASAAVLSAGLFFMISQLRGIYRSRRGASIMIDVVQLCISWVMVVLVLLLIAYAMHFSDEFSRISILTWFVAAPVLLGLWRGFVNYTLGELRRNGHNTIRVAIVGARELGAEFAQTLLDSGWMGLQPIGFYDDRKPTGDRPLVTEPINVIGDLALLVKHAQERKFDSVYITLPMRAEGRIRKLLEQLSDTTTSAYLVPDFFVYNLMNAGMTNLGEYPVVSIYETPFNGVDGWIKRWEDIALSLLILLVIAVPMAIIATGIKLTSPGQVIYRQARYGLRGESIHVWKFRTMMDCDNGDALIQAQRCDARITRFGAFLRRTSLDELPQFFNVLQGSMSIVGPHPHAIVHNELYRQQISGYMLRHKVKPGITGLAQINGWRGETDTLDKMVSRVKFDLAYIKDWSLLLDLKIITLSLFRGFSGKNVY